MRRRSVGQHRGRDRHRSRTKADTRWSSPEATNLPATEEAGKSRMRSKRTCCWVGCWVSAWRIPWMVQRRGGIYARRRFFFCAFSGIWDATPWIGRIVRGGHAPQQFSCDHCSPPPSRDSRDATSGCETQESSCRRCGQCRIIGVISDQRGGVLGGLRFQRVCSSPRPISLTKALQRPHSSTPAALLASH